MKLGQARRICNYAAEKNAIAEVYIKMKSSTSNKNNKKWLEDILDIG